jgi:uncharacterized membrane protein
MIKMTITTEQYATRAKYAHWLTLVGYFGLVIGIYLWHIVIHKTDHQMISLILVFQLGPLMFPLRGLLSGKIYTHAWAIYLAIFYFVIGIWYSGSKETWDFGIYLVGASLLFLAGTVLYTRFASRAEKAAQAD